MKFIQLFYIAIFLFIFQKSTAQTEAADTLRISDLAPVTVSAYRLEATDVQTPLALTIIGSYRLQHGQQNLALDEALASVPGVFVQNADNFSQDVRVSIRGFGARSAFGIRGIKIMLNGFPETAPDGQGQVDNIEPGNLESVGVIRGAASGLYGNASGGFINFNTLKLNELERLEASTSLGYFGFQKYQLKAGGGKNGKILYQIASSFTKLNGYREQSAMKNYLLDGGLAIPFDSTSQLIFSINYVNSPLAEDAGGITLDQAEAMPNSARAQNVQFDAGETLAQGRAGVSFDKKLNKHSHFDARAWHTRRTFSNKLPFQNGGIVELERAFSGLQSYIRHEGFLLKMPWQATLGLSSERQSDDRKRFDNLDGDKGPATTFDQQEIFSNFGLFASQSLELTERLRFHAGLRFDAIKLEAQDHFLNDGDDSGERNFLTINPIGGIIYLLTEENSIYFNAATAFETPTLSELSANPDGGGGFNDGLVPQKSASFEIGTKGLLSKGRLRYDLALFFINLHDEFVPYELPDFPGRTFFRNAATSQRMGLELGLGAALAKGFYGYLTYTHSEFQFNDYQTVAGDFEGNKLPGLPRDMTRLELRYFRNKGLYGVLTTAFTGRQFADDANEIETKKWVLTNFRLGWQANFGKWQCEPFLGVNNIFDTYYYSNLRLNAVGGRFYEPAAGRHFFGGVKISI